MVPDELCCASPVHGEAGGKASRSFNHYYVCMASGDSNLLRPNSDSTVNSQTQNPPYVTALTSDWPKQSGLDLNWKAKYSE